MRVGIDGYNLALQKGTGVATYARTLAMTVAELGHPIDLVYGLAVPRKTQASLRESLFYERLGEGDDASRTLNWTIRRALMRALISPWSRDLVEIPHAGQVVAKGFSERLPRFDRLFTFGGLFTVSARYFRRYGRFMTVRVPDPPSIMHWTYPVPIRMAGSRNLYTIHDLIPLRLPYTSLEDKSYYDALIRHCLQTAAQIVTVSESSRRDILDLFAVDPSRVTNTYQPVDVPSPESIDTELAVRLNRLFDLEQGEYLLFFGAIEPKKNVGRLIESYLTSGVQAPLVIVGAGGWHSDRELRLLSGAHGKRLAAADKIRVIDYLPRPLLMELVRGARAVLFPSLYEGFGLPAAEALALGAPVVAANTASLPEVVGKAALTVDPYDVGAMTAALRRIDSDAVLRSELAKAGPDQASNFSAARYQQAIAQLYCEVGERRSQRLSH